MREVAPRLAGKHPPHSLPPSSWPSTPESLVLNSEPGVLMSVVCMHYSVFGHIFGKLSHMWT